ncbi:MAG: threonylcarbamoyl-AMP synthase [Oscillospiraceae bacterium]|nr:threonylcarbamoyl-AMP synthase [Oscillospiraceae bacterium]
MNTKIITSEIHEAAEIIRSGGLVAVPTETVYGLAGNGMNETAVSEIYRVKGRPEVKPLSLMVHDASAMELYCEDVPKAAYALAEKFWPGPLTIVLKSKDTVPEIVRAGGSTVGLRCPDHPQTLALLQECGLPLAAPSANLSGAPSPKTAQEVLRGLGGEIHAVIDGGVCGIGLESTIIDMSQTPYRILRQGALSEEEIAQTLVENMTVFGITGGTGCGKTTALNQIDALGGLVIDCDEVYHRLGATSVDLREKLTARFGDVYENGVLNTKLIGKVVFYDPEALLELNAITHGAVAEETARMLRVYAMEGGRLAAVDAIALIESGMAEHYRPLVGILAPVEERVRRIMARDGINEDYARHRITSQKSDDFYREHCDKILMNDSTAEVFVEKCKHYFMEVIAEHERK